MKVSFLIPFLNEADALGKLNPKIRRDITINGIDAMVRPHTYIPTDEHDGATRPYVDSCFDGVILIVVLHPTTDPMILLREAKRVALSTIVVGVWTTKLGLYPRPARWIFDRSLHFVTPAGTYVGRKTSVC